MNVLLIMPDALRSSQMHCYGYEKETTPFLDRLASNGVLFSQAVSQSSHTYPGMSTTLTGLYPCTHRIHGEKDYNRIQPSLAETLRAVPGFEEWELPLDILNKNGYRIIGKYGRDYLMPLGCLTDIRDLPPVPEILEQCTGAPFFIKDMPYFTHVPYEAPQPYIEQFLPKGYEATRNLERYDKVIRTHGWGRVYNPEKACIDFPVIEFERFEPLTFSSEDRPGLLARYDAAVRRLDSEVEAYVTKLDDLGLLDETLIVITSDHGEEILERGSLGHASCSLAGTLYEESIRIPLILHCPKLLPKGRVIDTQVSQVNIMPTILDLLDKPIPSGTEGQSLLPLIRTGKAGFEEATWLEAPVCGWQAVPESDSRMVFALRTPQWKLIYNFEGPARPSSYELYNLIDDGAEANNLSDAEPGIASHLEAKLLSKIRPRLNSFQGSSFTPNK